MYDIEISISMDDMVQLLRIDVCAMTLYLYFNDVIYSLFLTSETQGCIIHKKIQ